MSASEKLLCIAVYLRKSRLDPEDETTEETLSRHKKTLLHFAKTNKLNIVAIYEEVVSGDGLFVRPEMIKLLSDIEADKFSGVLCMDIDRLGRVDTKDRGIILDTFKTHNTRIITPRKVYDLNDELDEFSTEIQMLFARQELKKITQRLQQGVKRTVEDGYHVTEPPYGYRRVYVDKRPTLEIYEEEATVIRMIFDMYVNQGIGSCIIADTVNAMGYKTRKNTKFSRNTVRFFLQNPIYIGKIVWNKRKHIKKKNITDKHHSELNPETDWIVSDGVHEPIIDKELFDKAQAIRKTRSHPPSNTGEIKNSLAGLIRCKNCGQLMSRQTSRKTGPRLLCTNNACTKSTTIDKVEAALHNILRNSLKEFKIKIKETNSNENQETVNVLSAEISSVKKQLSTLEKQKESLHDFLEQGVYSIDTFTERAGIIANNIKKLNNTLDTLEKQMSEINLTPAYAEIIPTLEELVNNYNDLTPSEKNVMLKRILTAIYYERKREPKSEFSLSVMYKKWL